MKKILILGIGNTLLSDEGIGVVMLDKLKKALKNKYITYLDGGTLSFTLAPDIEDCDYLIVLDAAKLNSPAGSVAVLENKEMDEFITQGNCSVHEVGIADLLDIVRLTEKLPNKRALIGIQPENLGWGEVISPSVEKAIPKVIDEVKTLLSRWVK